MNSARQEFTKKKEQNTCFSNQLVELCYYTRSIIINLKFYQMKKNVIFLLMAFATLNLTARTPAGGPDPGPAVFAKATEEKVSPLIEAKFKKQYGPIINVSWKVINDISIATYNDQGEQRDVYYYNDGEVFG